MKAVPEPIRKAAKERLEATIEDQASVQDAIRKGRPLDAEDNRERKLAFIQNTIGVNREIAAHIANYEDPKKLPLTTSQQAEAESLQGLTVDFEPIRFLEMARAASRSVARVAFKNRSPQGTGFMVSPHLFLTNHHVISSIAEAQAYALEFNYEEDVNLNRTPVTRFLLDPTRLFLFDQTDDLDFALVAVGPQLDGDGSLEDFGFLPLFDTLDKHMKAIFVNVIQHPEGRPKEVVLRENRILARTSNTLIYGADTLKGSSGSPVFNNDWEVVALHHWASPYRAHHDDVADLPAKGNEGIRISSIVEHLRNELKNLPAANAVLLQEALEPSFRHPSLYKGNNQERTPSHMTQPKDDKRHSNYANLEVSADGTATWTVPLVVSVRLGIEGASPIPPVRNDTPVEGKTEREDGTPGEPEAFKFVPDPNYSNRRGYNPKFLGIEVDLPKLTAAQQAVAARNLKPKAGDDPFEVKYQHFSIVMNGERRLPFFTAGNIDGASVVNINRKTGVVKSVEDPNGDDEGAEAYERWYDDERIHASQRSDQSLYSSAALKNFQRGHMVKRTDPSWGSVERAFRGQADTFHFTNCAPQHEKFNPIKTRWAGIEDWITNGSDDEDMRVTVFTGPVLRKDDPKRSYIQVPREFWKIVVRVEDGELLATAVLADQTEFISEEESSGSEDLPPFPDKLPPEYQCTVREIEELTGLDFGPLRDHDTFDGGSESTTSRRLISKFEEIQFHRPKSTS